MSEGPSRSEINRKGWQTRRGNRAQRDVEWSNARKMNVLQLVQRTFPADAIVGYEHDAILVRYDGKVYRIAVEEV